MFKITIALFAVIACAVAKPAVLAPVAYSAPLVAPGVVTATSSQVFARNYNGLAAAPLVAAPVAAPLVAAPVAAPLSAPLVASPASLAYTTPFATQFASPYVAQPAFSSPLTYTAPFGNYLQSPVAAPLFF